jgi:hypothetical protein
MALLLSLLLPLLVLSVAGAGFVALTAWRPAVGGCLFAFAIPVTTGLVRGTVVPLLRVNEVLLLLLLAGLVLNHFRDPKRHPVTMLDIAVGLYALGSIVVAALVLFVNDPSALRDLETLRVVLSPAQFFLIYLVFSRAEFSGRTLPVLLNLSMLASIIVSLVALVELVNLGGIRPTLTAFFPPEGNPSPWDPVYRPASTLGHYSAVGAFGAINYTLALSLLTMRHPAFSRLWLSVVMAINMGGLVASLTWAPLLVLPLVTAVVLWQGRRVPRELGMVVAALSVAFVLLWPNVNARGTQQGILSSAGVGLTIPHTFDYRMHFWGEFFVPALVDHLWLGTGTVLPSVVPTRLTTYVDNEYLRQGFRAGLLGVAFLLIMQGTIAFTGWRSRASPDAVRRSLGATSLALALFFLLCGLVGEYLFFAGVSQEFAMIIALTGASARVARPARQVVLRRWESVPLPATQSGVTIVG